MSDITDIKIDVDAHLWLLWDIGRNLWGADSNLAYDNCKSWDVARSRKDMGVQYFTRTCFLTLFTHNFLNDEIVHYTKNIKNRIGIKKKQQLHSLNWKYLRPTNSEKK